jgi:hypothetical protein
MLIENKPLAQAAELDFRSNIVVQCSGFKKKKDESEEIGICRPIRAF